MTVQVEDYPQRAREQGLREDRLTARELSVVELIASDATPGSL
jgi:ATP/maltotriose-dependent transcriptional regulator MalT